LWRCRWKPMGSCTYRTRGLITKLALRTTPVDPATLNLRQSLHLIVRCDASTAVRVAPYSVSCMELWGGSGCKDRAGLDRITADLPRPHDAIVSGARAGFLRPKAFNAKTPGLQYRCDWREARDPTRGAHADHAPDRRTCHVAKCSLCAGRRHLRPRQRGKLVISSSRGRTHLPPATGSTSSTGSRRSSLQPTSRGT
jgi:hypothetical protein